MSQPCHFTKQISHSESACKYISPKEISFPYDILQTPFLHINIKGDGTLSFRGWVVEVERHRNPLKFLLHGFSSTADIKKVGMEEIFVEQGIESM